MTTNWKNQSDAERYFTRTRVARRFRYHVRNPSNPFGRIRREPCAFCGARKTSGHHTDYDKTFVVVWVCDPCHRKVERRELKVKHKHLHDYTSLVIQRPGGWRRGPSKHWREEAESEVEDTGELESAPF